MNRSQILTHRGLEPSKPDFFPESSIEAFINQLHRGFGIEFDPNFVKDGIVINHDSNLKRITKEKTPEISMILPYLKQQTSNMVQQPWATCQRLMS